MDDPGYKVIPAALEKYHIDANWRQYALYIVYEDQEMCLGLEETSHSAPLDGSDWKRQPDLFMAPSRTTKRNGTYNLTDVRVIGELKQSENPERI